MRFWSDSAADRRGRRVVLAGKALGSARRFWPSFRRPCGKSSSRRQLHNTCPIETFLTLLPCWGVACHVSACVWRLDTIRRPTSSSTGGASRRALALALRPATQTDAILADGALHTAPLPPPIFIGSGPRRPIFSHLGPRSPMRWVHAARVGKKCLRTGRSSTGRNTPCRMGQAKHLASFPIPL